MKDKYSGLEVAIIGIACNFPNSKNHYEFWKNLNEKEWLLKSNSQNNLITIEESLDRKDFFDSSFFGYSQLEASYLNPSSRMFHECIWNAIEDAGINLDKQSSISVFCGAGDDLNWRVYTSLKNEQLNQIDNYSLNYLNNINHLPTLISYKLNLHGPSLSINTACSTSLVAIDRAYRSLLLGESYISVAGGIYLNTLKNNSYKYLDGGILSSDGKCRSFDEKSSGTVVGEGCGVIVLKRLENAIKDKDNIYAIIKGSSVNNDGSRKVGYTAPSSIGQTECIDRAFKFSGVLKNSINYIETHGTGTKLGDSIEIESLKDSFKEESVQIPIGSVKPNIGHLDAAAGVAGMIKGILSVYNKKLVSNLFFDRANHNLNIENTNLHIIKENHILLNESIKIGVSSFGIGGTNAHIIIENPPKIKKELKKNKRVEIIVLSAKTNSSLTRIVNKYIDLLETNKEINFSDLSYTLQVGRKAFSKRFSIICTNKEECLLKMKENQVKIFDAKIDKIIFYFSSGLNELNIDSFREYYYSNSVFREVFDNTLKKLSNPINDELNNFFFNKEEINFNSNSLLKFSLILNYSLCKFLIELNIKPNDIIGNNNVKLINLLIENKITLGEAIDLVDNKNIQIDNLVFNKDHTSLVVEFGKTNINNTNSFANYLTFDYNSLELVIAELISKSWDGGININWDAYNKFSENYKISLPTYSFENTFYQSRVDPFGHTNIEIKDNKLNLTVFSRDNIKSSLEKILSEISDYSEDIDIDLDFNEIDIDSIKILQFSNLIEREFNISIPYSKLMNTSNINELTVLIYNSLNSDESSSNEIII